MAGGTSGPNDILGKVSETIKRFGFLRTMRSGCALDAHVDRQPGGSAPPRNFDSQHEQLAIPLDGLGLRVESSQDLSVSNCSVRT